MTKKIKPFKIAHISDLHLTKHDSDKRTQVDIFKPLTGMNKAFRAILKSNSIQKSDLVLVTGDVTDRGSLYAWENFWEAINKANLQEKVVVLPGNHDVCCLGARLPGNRKAYREKDIQIAVEGLKLGNQEYKFPWVITPDPENRVVIFGLNSNFLGNLNVLTNAMGELDYYQLKALASKMHVYRDIPVKIIALHHSPNIPEMATARKRQQKSFSKLERIGHQISQAQRRALILLCVTHRVRLLVHGHLHMPEDRYVSGVRIIGAPSITEPIIERKTFNEYQFFQYTVQGQGGKVKVDPCTIKINN